MTALGSPNLDCRQDGAQARGRRARRLSLQHRRSPAIEQADAHPAGRHQSALGSAGAECPHPQALAGAARCGSPVSARPSISPIRSSSWAPAPRRCASSPTASAASREVLKDAKRPMIIVGTGALARAGRRRGRCALARRPSRAAARRLERLQRAAHRGVARRRRSISALCRARAAATSAGILDGAQKGEIDVVYLLGADEFDTLEARQGLRGLSGPPRRCRRASRRCHPAGRRLHRKGWHLRQIGAGCSAATAPRSRRARPRRIGRSCAPVRAAGQDAALSTSSTRSARALFAVNQQLRRARPQAAGALGRVRQGGRHRPTRRSSSADRRFLSDQPDRRARETMAECSRTRVGAPKMAAE